MARDPDTQGGHSFSGSWLSRQLGTGLQPVIRAGAGGTQIVMRTIYVSRILIYGVNGIAWPLLLGDLVFVDPTLWTVWVIMHVAWPHVAYLHVRLRRDSWRAETLNLTVDFAIVGALVNELNYIVWYCLASVGAVAVASLAFGGIPLLARGLFAMLVTSTAWGIVRGFQFLALAPAPIELFGAAASAMPFLVVMFAVHQFMLALERARQSIKRKNEIVEGLMALGLSLQDTDDIDTLIERGLARIGALFPDHGFAVVLRDPDRPRIIHHARFHGLGAADCDAIVRATYATQPRAEVAPIGLARGDAHVLPLPGRLTRVGTLIVAGKPSDTDGRAALQLFVDQLGSALQRAELTRRLQHAADTDPLTGLYNRAYLQREYERAVRNRSTTGDQFSVVAIDVNGLKGVNDRHGHEAGDQMLLAAADRLRSVTRDSDVLVRMGGDEFVILCHACDQSSVREVTARIRDHARRTGAVPISLGAEAVELPLSLSIGAASSDETPVEHLLRTADDRMYAEKARYYSRSDQSSSAE